VRVEQASAGRSRFGDVVIVLFLLAQAADGVMTYVGVSTFGVSLEANPLLASLIRAPRSPAPSWRPPSSASRSTSSASTACSRP